MKLCEYKWTLRSWVEDKCIISSEFNSISAYTPFHFPRKLPLSEIFLGVPCSMFIHIHYSSLINS